MNTDVLKNRKLGFVEIGRGRLGVEMQAAFEQACISARDMAGAVKVNLTITVSPPELQEPNFGRVEYSIRTIEPPRKSAQWTTLLDKSGLPINEGSDQAAALQYELALQFPQTE